ncbi:uncharacterized protein T551_00583 [Pneumocystis jirovecii RU7]|uniref:Uncharacterized protein n=1 Tax=Pneumocystis jirovecii (strain RU7) TaxID=1408657 RepID=A0A0W4ZVV8_PNEJ7|nr:uncharacterized protein T551_00583 [Pneumocystis jirovecii RU7]KTW32493.1 hypothetical protein T551_00583 [Pneumocystis jirovecii RU7]
MSFIGVLKKIVEKENVEGIILIDENGLCLGSYGKVNEEFASKCIKFADLELQTKMFAAVMNKRQKILLHRDSGITTVLFMTR